jgi:hypothetical protein
LRLTADFRGEAVTGARPASSRPPFLRLGIIRFEANAFLTLPGVTRRQKDEVHMQTRINGT